MKTMKPDELIGKEVYDYQGNAIGVFDRYWGSWKSKDNEYFFGIRPYESIRDAWFRGTNKLIPISSSYIKDVSDTVTLKKAMTELSHEWRRTITVGAITWPSDDLMEKGIYDKNGSRVGVFFSWSYDQKSTTSYGCFIDPYLAEQWKYDYNTILPLKKDYFYYVTDSITLNASVIELKKYWDGYQTEKKPVKKTAANKPKAKTAPAKAKRTTTSKTKKKST
jgi:sporulation protein YlmC with PRC-barrel domain